MPRALVLALSLTGCASPSSSAPATMSPETQAAAPAPAPAPSEPEGPACGDAEACMALAAELDASDPAAATEAFYGACLGGNVDGCEQAGLRWQKEVDTTAESPLNAKIMDAFERSCALGGGLHGCGNVGLAYFYGTRGMSVDVDKAVQYMTKSCEEQKNKFVCRRLEEYRSGKVQPGVLPK